MPLEAVELLDAVRRALTTRKHETQAALIVTYELHLCLRKADNKGGMAEKRTQRYEINF